MHAGSIFSQKLDRVAFTAYFMGAVVPLGALVLLAHRYVFPALTEEVAFRGLLQHWLHVAVRATTAIVLASALFAAMHFSVISFPYLFAVGLLLGWMRWRTGSLWPPIVAHFLHNLVVLAYLGG